MAGQRFSDLYALISNRELGDCPASVFSRVAIIRALERECNQQFTDTKDFHEKCRRHIAKIGGPSVRRVKVGRKKD